MSRQQRTPDQEGILQPKIDIPECKTGRTIYVDNNRLDNYDPNGSEQKPYKSINEALLHVPAFDIGILNFHVIMIMPGNYNETIYTNIPVGIQGLDRWTCRIFGNISSNAAYFFISNMTFQNFTLSTAAIFAVDRCDLADVDITNAVGDFSSCTMNSVEFSNSRATFANNCLITSNLTINSDGDELYPLPGKLSYLIGRDLSIEGGATITLNLANDGEIRLDFSHSFVEGAITMATDVTVNNYNSTLLNLTQGDGTYTNYAGYPDAI